VSSDSSASPEKTQDYTTEKMFAKRAFCVLVLNLFSEWWEWSVMHESNLALFSCYVIMSYLLLRLIAASLAQVFHRRKSVPLWRLLIPPTIVVLLVFLIFNLPAGEWNMKIDFSLKRAEREEVVRMIEAGKLELYVGDALGGGVTVPQRYAKLSVGDRVIFEYTDTGINVLFFTYLGLLSNSSGYAYVTEDSELAVRIFTHHKAPRQIIKLRDHWYWVVY
jgi:hypothetical protein